ncbi:MAG: TonB-dependent receptor plug domain-containing protein [Ginsengibacter sp.]
MRKNVLLLLATLIFGLKGFGQSANSGFNIAGDLTQFFSHHSFENAYLQFDKPYYAAGDTIYFKAYVTEGEQHQLSELSGVLHVDLINSENKIDQSIKLQLRSGISWGDFALAESLPAGNYRIRAYTQLMRNNGETDFFERNIPVGSVSNDKKDKNQQTLEKNNKPDIQFFPEGGNLVNGLRSKVAFKAIGENGLGIGVKGIIIDNKNNIIDSLASTHLGMGYFYLDPEKGKNYKVELTFADRKRDTVSLPKAQTSGLTLTVDKDDISKMSFKIEANEPYILANRHKNYLLLIYSGGKSITYKINLEVEINILEIQKKLLQTGVNVITLFSANGEPLCERLLFVKNKSPLNLQIKSEKKIYAKREKVNLDLVAKNGLDSMVPGHFSVSVIDEKIVSEYANNEHTILTDLLLTSELKGHVEQPNYYFNDSSNAASENLDNLMLTQDYRRFEWKQIMDTSYDSLAFQPEKALDISGKVTNLSGKPLENATVNLIPYHGDTILTRKTDDKGIFHFSNVAFMDTIHVALNAINSKGRNSTRITYFNENDAPAISAMQIPVLETVKDTAMSVYLENAKKVQEEYSLFKGKILKTVVVKGKLPLDNKYRTESLAGAGNADQVMHAKEIERIGGQLSTSLNGRLLGVGFSNDTPYLRSAHLESAHGGIGGMLVVIDGAIINPNGGPVGINTIPLSQVETVEVLRFASASIYGMNGGNGVLVITTKQGDEKYKDDASFGILSIDPVGFYKAREFYSPKYDDTNEDSKRPDLRSTIYWNPEIKTGKDGNASLDYYNADGTGTYKVTVEGIDENGDIGRAVYRYKVE